MHFNHLDDDGAALQDRCQAGLDFRPLFFMTLATEAHENEHF